MREGGRREGGKKREGVGEFEEFEYYRSGELFQTHTSRFPFSHFCHSSKFQPHSTNDVLVT